MRTALCDLLNIEQPILQGGMAWVADASLASAVSNGGGLDVVKLKRKSLSLHWEFMYTRSLFQTEDMVEQHRILTRAASLTDAGELRSPLTRRLGPINAANLREAHRLLESGRSIGKLALEGWG